MSCFLFVTCLLLISSVAHAYSTYTVDARGGGHFQTIQAAIDAASDGDMIEILGHITENNVRIHKSLILQGQGVDTTIINGNDGTVFYPLADDVLIRFLTIQNAKEGIRFEKPGETIMHPKVEKIVIRNGSERGIECRSNTKVQNLIISGRIFDNVGYGLKLGPRDSFANVSIYNAEFRNNIYGIYQSDERDPDDTTHQTPQTTQTITDMAAVTNEVNQSEYAIKGTYVL